MRTQSLKPGWKMVKFGDVVRQCKESVDRDNNPFERYVEGGHMDSENIHIRRWGEFGTDYVGPAFHRIFRKGQVLYGSRRTYLKKVAIADFDGITANTTFVCETKDQSVFMRELLPFLMLTDSFTGHSIRESKGSTNPYINWPDIAKYEFPLPPLNEQKRIAKILWAADEAFEYWKKCQAKADDAYRLDIAARLTAGGAEWDEKPIGQLCFLSNGRGFKSSEWSEKGYPIIRIQNLNGSREFNHFDGELEERWLVRSGQLLYAWAGVKGMSFGPRIWDGPTGGLNQHIFKIEPNSGIGKRWLFEILQLITSEVEKDAHGFKKELVHIRKSWLTEHLVPVPPEGERNNIETIALKWDDARQTIAVHINALLVLMRSMINTGLIKEGLCV